MGRLCTGKLTPQKMSSANVKMLAKTMGFLKKKQKPPINSPKPAIVNAVRATVKANATMFV